MVKKGTNLRWWDEFIYPKYQPTDHMNYWSFETTLNTKYLLLDILHSIVTFNLCNSVCACVTE